MKKTPFVPCEDVGNIFELQSFNSKLQTAVDIYVAWWWKRKKILKNISNDIQAYLHDVFGEYIWKEILIETHTGKIKGILTKIVSDGGIVGPYLNIQIGKNGNWAPVSEIIWVQLLQYWYKFQIREAQTLNPTLEFQDSVQEKVAELVH